MTCASHNHNKNYYFCQQTLTPHTYTASDKFYSMHPQNTLYTHTHTHHTYTNTHTNAHRPNLPRPCPRVFLTHQRTQAQYHVAQHPRQSVPYVVRRIDSHLTILPELCCLKPYLCFPWLPRCSNSNTVLFVFFNWIVISTYQVRLLY
jgi:hypothetical protein